MANNTFTSSINQSSTSSRMKILFFLLCISLCLISFILYSTTNMNWIYLKSYIHLDLTSNQTVNEFNTSLNYSQTRRFAIYGCSIHSTTQAYIFYTPMIASAWKRAGYESIVVFVGDFTLPNVLTARLNLSRNYLKHVGAHILDIQCDQSYATKLSQLVRVFSGFLPDSIVHDDDDILTGDSDLMPLRTKDYLPTVGTDGFIFNAFCCGSFQRRNRSYKMFPMGHIYLKKKTWRAMVVESQQHSELLVKATNQTLHLLNKNASLSFDLISLYARHEFQDVYDSKMTKGDAAWYMDQVLCSMLLTDYRENHSNIKIHERGRGERLDRADSLQNWNRDNFDKFGDAHLYHDMIFQESNWKIFNKLLNALFDKQLVQLFNDYYKQYIVANNLPIKQTK